MANIPPHPPAAPRLLFAFAWFTLLASCCAGAAPFSPPWWVERGVVATSSPVSTNDYAAATQGQVKWMADRAMAELNDKLPGGAGAAVSNLVASFSGASANDYAGLNGGQLKAVAAPFYDRLRAAGWPCILPQGMTTNNLYPWASSSSPANDYAMVNIGQVKYAFSFIVLKVEMTNLKFNHDTGSSSSDALNIRQDFDIPFDISNGEWVKDVANIPVCYTTNKAVTIKARFTVQPASITSADIWALSTDSGGSLGDVIKTNVTFSGGVSVGDANGFVTFQVSGTTPSCIQKTTNDVWQWKMEYVNGAGSASCDLNTSGVHSVYTILNEPVSPWVNTAGNKRNAWTKALDFAVVSASCNGDSTASNALSHIAQYLHTGHGLIYDTGDVVTGEAGRPKYASSSLGGTMNLTGYIDKSSTLYGTAGNVINCYDQASGVCAFGRLLGVSVTYRYMSPFGYINTVNLVGEGNCNNPFYPLTTGGKITGPDEVAPVRSGFGNHAFTSFGGYVFDACAGPHLGTRTEAQYVSDTVDSSTPAEAAVAGDTSNISFGGASGFAGGFRTGLDVIGMRPRVGDQV